MLKSGYKKKNKKNNLQSGGGMHSEYCPLCELAYEELPEIDDDDDDDDDEDDDERQENPLKKLVNIDLKWLQNGLGFDRDTKTILHVAGDDMYGQFPIKGRRGESFTAEMYGEGEFGWGPVFHEDCIACISAQLKRPVTYEDGIELFELVGEKSVPYGDQHFDWDSAVREEGIEYFYSPMDTAKGAQTRNRILRKIDGWLSKQKRVASPTGRKQLQREDAVKALERARADLKQALSKVDELKREVAAREAALAALSSPSPASSSSSSAAPLKGGPTKKRAPKKRAPKLAAAAASVSCASYKTKETCPPTECVWGKTNRCSKKRKA
jgi:hypothetical protein